MAWQDAALLEGILRGQEKAEETLQEKYGARVYYLGLKAMESPPDAEDVCAETLSRVCQAIREKQVQTPNALAPYILNCAHDVIDEFLRDQERMARLAKLHEDRMKGITPGFLRPAVQRAIEQTIRGVTARNQVLLRMYCFDELSQQEILRRTGIRETQFRQLRSRAVKRFRGLLEAATKSE